MSDVITAELPAAASSPRRARKLVRQALETWGLADGARITELLASELVTNAVRHAASPVVVKLSCQASTVRVEIVDRGSEMPALIEVPDTGGYGLRIVDRLSSRWGVDQVPGLGKNVWFELDMIEPLVAEPGGATRGSS